MVQGNFVTIRLALSIIDSDERGIPIGNLWPRSGAGRGRQRVLRVQTLALKYALDDHPQHCHGDDPEADDLASLSGTSSLGVGWQAAR